MKTMKWLKTLGVVTILLLTSCETIRVEKGYLLPPSQGRVVFYMHLAIPTPPDVEFTLAGLELEKEENKWISIIDTPMDITSKDLIDRQVLIKEVIVDPGLYKKIRFYISKAAIKGKDGYVNLALPQPGGEHILESTFRVKPHESAVVSLAWDPEESISKGYLFQPSFHIEPQGSSLKGLLLFVSNSGSDYISVIDRGIERVIRAIDVGKNPKGMALNPNSEMLYVVNTGSRTISIVDTTLLSLRDTIQLTPSIEPTEIAFLADTSNPLEGKLYITDKRANNVLVVDTSARRVRKTLTVGIAPSHVAVDPVRKEAYVTNEGSDTLSIIDASEDVITNTITVDPKPAGVLVGKEVVLVEEKVVFVFSEGSLAVSVVSPVFRRVIRTIPIG
ncbi:MAG: hypothetical protein ACE5IH_08150, partial [Thermodesulfobacteriota bacterium]